MVIITGVPQANTILTSLSSNISKNISEGVKGQKTNRQGYVPMQVMKRGEIEFL